jgi:hypothetical protein
LPCCNTATYKRLRRVLCCQCSYTAHTTKQRTGLYSGVSCYLPHSTAADARPTQTAIIPHTPRRTLCSSTQTAYYNNVYKRVQHTADHASPAGSAPTVCRSLASAAPGVPAEGSAPPPVQGQPGGLRSGTGSACRPPPGRAVQQQGRGGRRGTIDGYRRISFRAFAR